MRDVIWKFKLTPIAPYIDVPKDARLLAVGAQGDDLVAWYRCNPDAPTQSRFVGAYPTGVDLPDYLGVADHVGTVQMQDGLVFHIFEAGTIERDGVMIGIKERSSA